jgi:multiple sugar transport system ATP-binding protein
LDAKLRAQMRTEIAKLHKRLGTTFIYVTHDQTEAMTMGDKIVVMKDGIIQQVDSPQNLYEHPCNEFVAGFMGSPQMNFIDAKITNDGDDFFVNFGSNKLKIPAEKAKNNTLKPYIGKGVTFGIRPEDVYDSNEYVSSHPENKMKAKVEITELMGAEIYLYLDVEKEQLVARVAPTSKAQIGDVIDIAADMSKMHLFDKETEISILK